MKKCDCGCNQWIHTYDITGKIKRFKANHHNNNDNNKPPKLVKCRICEKSIIWKNKREWADMDGEKICISCYTDIFSTAFLNSTKMMALKRRKGLI
jgi:hypothetical protein